MIQYRVRWTEGGTEYVSAVAYDEGTAQSRVSELEAKDGVSNVDSFEVKPGE